MKDLTGKVVLLTGGAQGLGAEFACSFAGYGAKVVIADWKDAGSTIERVERNGGEAWARKVDVRDATHLDSLVKEIIAVYGRVDVLVNCAAIAVDLNMKPFYEIDREDWQRVMDVNATGTFECMKAVAPHMISQRSGKIINIASTTYVKGAARMLHYVASKGAVVGMTRVAARDLGAFDITVNCIAPGLTMTDAMREKSPFSAQGNLASIDSRALKREQLPSDLFGAVLFLSTQMSDFISGQTLVVDGGGVML